ncbi:serine threonine kinase [Fusarium beomiforme]|uniref:Serine threonine kinase n=1 Tax=Fusarium beomiforme TaxID=44412 RepID=A0A9P5AP81_9HYPO|nr:serine threonine kinase [Fusarium beomiforme]
MDRFEGILEVPGAEIAHTEGPQGPFRPGQRDIKVPDTQDTSSTCTTHASIGPERTRPVNDDEVAQNDRCSTRSSFEQPKCSLDKKLRQKVKESHWPPTPRNKSQAAATAPRKYILRSDLEGILTYCNIRDLFELEKLYKSPELEEKARYAAGLSESFNNAESRTDGLPISEASHTPKVPNLRRILAVLILLNKVKTIKEIIKEGITDHDLPFRQDGSRLWRMDGDNSRSIRAFDAWIDNECDSFHNYQWYMLAPFFPLATDEQPKATKECFSGDLPLPFEVLKNAMEEEFDFAAHSGGFSNVQKVRIDPAHHSQRVSDDERNNTFAIKSLKRTAEDLFDLEFDALLKVAERNHKNLIRLLVAFTSGSEQCFVFPWADHNLKQFWSNRPPDPDTLARTRWVAKQLEGLTDALQVIHDPDHLPEECRKTHGRHGDLKPENILWFEKENVLKIADLGLTEFHSKETLEQSGRKKGRTGTYRTPEHDSYGKGKVVPASDLWSLGCIFLEFLSWHVGGWDRVNRFSEIRAQEENGKGKGKGKENNVLTEDKFFKPVPFSHTESGGSLQAILKDSVKDEITSLRSHSTCSEFILDVLKIIEVDLLRINPDDRASCETVRDKFKLVQEECSNNDAFDRDIAGVDV